MRYMVIETFRPGQRDAVYVRFDRKGRMLPDGLHYLDSWPSAQGDRCFQLMETQDPALLELWSEAWRDLVSFEFIALGARPAPVAESSVGLPKPLSMQAIREAHQRVRPYVLRTPLLRHSPNESCELLLKAESLQPTGAFKLRGAFNLMCTLTSDCPGVVAHSSGNHAQAVAYAAKRLGIPAVIVMPNDAPALKRERTQSQGAEIVVVGPDSDERVQRARQIAEQRGWVEVPPYNHPLVAAGQGTVALELWEDAGERDGSGRFERSDRFDRFDRFYAPISGGGLMAGCAVAVRGLCPEAEIVGAEPEDADDARRSLAAGERLSIPPPKTLADGLRVRTLGEVTWPVIRDHVDRIECVSDEEMLDAMAYALQVMRLVVEPSGACALALALREAREVRRPRQRWAVVLSGGNLAAELLAEVAAREFD